MVWSLKNISGVKPNMIVGMAGILDSARFRYFLSKELNISLKIFKQWFLVDMEILWFHFDFTSLSGIPIKKFIEKKIYLKEKLDEIIERTRNGGGE